MVYTPTVGEPGFVSGFTVHYDLVSDGKLPEPSSWVLLGTVLLSLVIIFRRAHRTRRTV